MGIYSGAVRNSALTNENVQLPDPDGKFHSAMELALESACNDMKMFESLIEMDFMEVSLGEASDEANGVAKENIGQKIKKIISAAIERIKKFFSNAIAKVSNLFDKDKKLYAKYKDVFNAGKLKDFKVTDYTPIKNVDPFDILDKMRDAMNKVQSIINKDSDVKAEVDKILKAEVFGEEGMEEVIKKMAFEDMMSGENFLPNDQIAIITDIIKDGKKSINRMKSRANKCIKYLKEIEKVDFKNHSKDAKDDALVIEKKRFDVANTFISQMSKTVSLAHNAMIKQLMTARKIWIAGGAFASKQGQGTADGRDDNKQLGEAVMQAIMFGSDAFVEQTIFG